MNGLAGTVWSTLRQEFSDISDAEAFTRIAIRMLLAVALGGLLGYERERSGKAAGLRTHMLVALGAALFVLAPIEAGMDMSDLSRVTQGIISGIGFLGAGAIIKLSSDGQIKGLTTSASIWLTAAIGVAAGMGRESTAVLSTVFALIILGLLRSMERRIAAQDENDSRRNGSTRHDDGRDAEGASSKGDAGRGN